MHLVKVFGIIAALLGLTGCALYSLGIVGVIFKNNPIRPAKASWLIFGPLNVILAIAMYLKGSLTYQMASQAGSAQIRFALRVPLWESSCGIYLTTPSFLFR